jgi:hypothetical protein
MPFTGSAGWSRRSPRASGGGSAIARLRNQPEPEGAEVVPDRKAAALLAPRPAEEGEEVSIAVERGELASSEIGLANPVLRNWVQHTLRLQFRKERIDVPDLDSTAGRSGQEGLRAGADRLAREVRTRAPFLVARAPQVEHCIVSNEDGESWLLERRFKSESL